jgi:hypothetical protein
MQESGSSFWETGIDVTGDCVRQAVGRVFLGSHSGLSVTEFVVQLGTDGKPVSNRNGRIRLGLYNTHGYGNLASFYF